GASAAPRGELTSAGFPLALSFPHPGSRRKPPEPSHPDTSSLKREPFPRRNEPANKYRINRQIRVPQVRLIDHLNEQRGVVSAAEARRIGDEAGMDLAEVQPNADPPVCRVMDFGKFKYAQKKKERGQSKSHSTLKELRVRPAIDPHDLEYRL